MIKVLSLFALLVSTPVAAQNLTEMMLEGMAREGASRAEEMLQKVPEQLQEYLTERQQEFETEQECVSELQLLANAGAIASNVMPFSSVWAYEDKGYLRTRLRLVLNGERFQADFWCDGSRLIGDVLEWNAPLPPFPKYDVDTLNAAFGVFVIQYERDEFEKRDQTSATEEENPIITGALEKSLQYAETLNQTAVPLTQAEIAKFRMNVQECWVVDVESPATNVTVTVGFDMDPIGRVVSSSIRLLSSGGGSGSDVDDAFQAARRAILRCQGDGYGLPISKYENWKYAEMTFNAVSMRIR